MRNELPVVPCNVVTRGMPSRRATPASTMSGAKSVGVQDIRTKTLAQRREPCPLTHVRQAWYHQDFHCNRCVAQLLHPIPNRIGGCDHHGHQYLVASLDLPAGERVDHAFQTTDAPGR